MAINKNIRHNPFICFLFAIGNVLRGRIHFSKEYKGKTLRMDDGQTFTIFRHVTLVLGIMNKRSIQESLSYTVLPNTRLSEYMEKHLIKGEQP